MFVVGIAEAGKDAHTAGLIQSLLDSCRVKGVSLVRLNPEDYPENGYEDVDFDMIVRLSTPEEGEVMKNAVLPCTEEERKLLGSLDEDGIVIINSDNQELLSLMTDIKARVITYGFNQKASITTSSVGDMNFGNDLIYCIQRTVCTLEDKVIEPQELSFKLNSAEREKIYQALAVITTLLLCGADYRVMREIPL